MQAIVPFYTFSSWLRFQLKATLANTSNLIQFPELPPEKKKKARGQPETDVKINAIFWKNKLDKILNKPFENII